MGNEVKTVTLTRKIQLFPKGDKDEIDRVYKFLRDGQYAQYLGLNRLMGELASEFYKNNRKLDDNFTKRKNEILRNSNELLDDIEFAVGLDTKSAITRKVKQDFSTAIRNGLAKGERAITNYKRTNPLIFRGRNLKFVHEYESLDELNKNLYKRNVKIGIETVNKIKFDVILGNPGKSIALRSELFKIFTNEYKVLESKIKFEKDKQGKENKIILLLSMAIPKKEGYTPKKGNKMAVKFGENVTALCMAQTNLEHEHIVGKADEFLRVRTSLQQQRYKIQSNLKYSKGGHGRRKKLKAYDRLSKRESGFVKNYNHNISKEIIEYAKRQKVETIILEDLSKYNNKTKKKEEDEKDKNTLFITTKWSYYQLQEFIKYKAEKEGINVELIKVDLNLFDDTKDTNCTIALAMLSGELKEKMEKMEKEEKEKKAKKKNNKKKSEK